MPLIAILDDVIQSDRPNAQQYVSYQSAMMIPENSLTYLFSSVLFAGIYGDVLRIILDFGVCLFSSLWFVIGFMVVVQEA